MGRFGSNKENARAPPSHIFREGGAPGVPLFEPSFYVIPGCYTMSGSSLRLGTHLSLAENSADSPENAESRDVFANAKIDNLPDEFVTRMPTGGFRETMDLPPSPSP